MGTKVSDIPKRPVRTDTHEGVPVSVSRYTCPTVPILCPSESITSLPMTVSRLFAFIIHSPQLNRDEASTADWALPESELPSKSSRCVHRKRTSVSVTKSSVGAGGLVHGEDRGVWISPPRRRRPNQRRAASVGR